MLRLHNQDHAFAVLCDESGNILKVLIDVKGFFLASAPVASFQTIMSMTSRAEFYKFLHAVMEFGYFLRNDIVLIRDSVKCTFCFFGLCKNEQTYIVAVQSAQQLFSIYDEFTSMINDQARLLRDVQKKSVSEEARQSSMAKSAMLNDYTILNNELANMQRELAIKNRLLQVQEKRFRDLVSFIPDAQLVLGKDNRILFLNPAAERLLGMRNSESEGQVLPLDLSRETEVSFSSPAGKVCLEVMSIAIDWGETPAVLVCCHDVTQRKLMEQMREDVQRIVQHDLISPLNPIISIPQLLCEEENLTEEQKMMLDLIQQAGTRMLRMIRLSLNLYKMELGTYAYNAAPVDILAILREVLADQSFRMRSKGVRVSIFAYDQLMSENDAFWVQGESTLCYSVFANLLLNGIEASGKNGEVRITLETSADRYARIAINNAGDVPAEIRATFFEKYSTHGKSHGTGLGTYSAKLIVATMGGAIDMRTGEGQGTTVTVALPMADGLRRF